MKSYLDTVERLGYALPKELGVSLILNSLNKDYDQFVQNYNMHSMGKTLVELHAMLKLHEKGILKKVETLAVLAIREGKIQKDKKKPRGKRDNPTKDSIFHHFEEVGHWRRNCPSYHAELKKRKNASEASTSGSRKLKYGALSLYIGNGMRAAVEAIRSFDLILPSGLIIVLDNCHFVPTVTRGVVSISRLVKNDMHNLYPNISSNYNVSNKRSKHGLDSYYLWHCRLGHINKKRMDMLQHDGLMQPTHEESHEKSRILNMVPTKKVDRTPYELWNEKAPKFSYLRVWGYEALVKRDTPEKLDSRSIKCIFVGYPKETIEASESHGLLKLSGSDKV
ncbi:zinc finger, CCHC-type containing protein [Tanacetum coccineum]